MQRRNMWGWLLAMLIVMTVAVCFEKQRRSDALSRSMSLGAVIDGRLEEHLPRLVTIEATEGAIGRLQRGVLVEVVAQHDELIQRRRVRGRRGRARGPPERRRREACTTRQSPDRKERTC
jgi:hypothetical protein